MDLKQGGKREKIKKNGSEGRKDERMRGGKEGRKEGRKERRKEEKGMKRKFRVGKE